MRTQLFIGLLLSAFNALAWTNIGAPGELHMTITIKQPTCELEDLAQEVDLGTMYLNSHRLPGDTLGQKAFTIGVKNCGDVVRAFVKMDGTPDGNDTSLFALSGGATGVGLKVVNNLGVQQIPASSDPGDGMLWQLTAQQNNHLDYVASYVITQTPVTAGPAEALVDLTISYE